MYFKTKYKFIKMMFIYTKSKLANINKTSISG